MVREWVNLYGMQYILALDQGTTSSRAMLFDHAGSAVAAEPAEFTPIFPRPGWGWPDALGIWGNPPKGVQKGFKKGQNWL